MLEGQERLRVFSEELECFGEAAPSAVKKKETHWWWLGNNDEA